MSGIAFIGAGIVAQLYAKAIERGVPATFVGVYDPEPDSAQELVDWLGGGVFNSVEALLECSDVDAVIIVSPTHTHFETALACMEAGKHVLLEKPVAETDEEIDVLIECAWRTQRVCMPAHNYIYNSNMYRMRRLLAEQRLGELTSLWMLYNIYHGEELTLRYGGVLRAVAIHHAYSLIYLTGRPSRVMAIQSSMQTKQVGVEDQVMIICEMPNGALANLWVSFAASDPTNNPWTVAYKALGTKGGVSFNWDDAVVEDDGGPAWGLPNYVDSFWEELNFFLNDAIPGQALPLSTLQDAKAAQRIVDAAEASIVNHGAFQTVNYT